MFLKDLGTRIRSQRERLGLKQQDIANALQVSPQAVSKWERGENAPDILMLGPLSKVLGVSTDWLLDVYGQGLDVFEASVFVSSVSGAYEKSLHMDARDFAAWANGFFSQLTEAVLRYQGIPIKYMGDQFLAFFSGQEHQPRALQAAFLAREFVPEDLKIGLSCGDIYVGAVGHPDYARPDIMGETVNQAFLTMAWGERLPEGIAATEAFANQVEELATIGGFGSHYFKDGANPMQVRTLTPKGEPPSAMKACVERADRDLFWTRLDEGFKAGTPVTEALRNIERELAGTAMGKAVARVVAEVESGRTLSAALRNQPYVFGPSIPCLIEGGEYAGLVDEAVELIVSQMKRYPASGAYGEVRE